MTVSPNSPRAVNLIEARTSSLPATFPLSACSNCEFPISIFEFPFSTSRRLHHSCDRPGHPPPILGFFRQLLPPGGGQRVILSPPVVLRRAPLRSQQPLQLQPV